MFRRIFWFQFLFLFFPDHRVFDGHHWLKACQLFRQDCLRWLYYDFSSQDFGTTSTIWFSNLRALNCMPSYEVVNQGNSLVWPIQGCATRQSMIYALTAQRGVYNFDSLLKTRFEPVLNRVWLLGSRRGFFFLARSQQGQISQQDSCQDVHQEFFSGKDSARNSSHRRGFPAGARDLGRIPPIPVPISWVLLGVVYTVLSDLSLETFCKIEPSDNISEIMLRQEINYSDYCMVVSIIFLHAEFCPDQHFRNRVLTCLDYVSKLFSVKQDGAFNSLAPTLYPTFSSVQTPPFQPEFLNSESISLKLWNETVWITKHVCSMFKNEQTCFILVYSTCRFLLLAV